MINTQATSILEMLTHQNPATEHEEPSSKTNTRSNDYFGPKQLKPWTDFQDLQIFKNSFSGRLFQEARQGGRTLPYYPDILSEDTVIREEPEARDLIHKWYRHIVLSAFKPIENDFKSLLWIKGRRPDQKQVVSPPPPSNNRRILPERNCSKEAKKPKKISMSLLTPDSGGISRDSITPGSGKEAKSKLEMFPKEYKPATKWKSEYLNQSKLLDANGEWKTGKSRHNHAMPIRQAFTYCIQNMCRYGCILTDREAFIFQISSRDKKSGNPGDLRKSLINNGLMEFISIPYTNHCIGDLDNHDTWTMNLALWFMHILAADSHQADWSYSSLREEPLGKGASSSLRLVNQDRTTGRHTSIMEGVEEEDEDSDASSSSSTDRVDLYSTPPTTKRKRGPEEELEEEEDVANFSFSSQPTKRKLFVS